jgi:hypothetical protein
MKLVAGAALVCFTLTVARDLEQEQRALYLSFLAVAWPLAALALVRVALEPGAIRDVACMLALCAPEGLLLGLCLFSGPLGLDAGSSDLGLLPATAFFCLVGPWFCGDALHLAALRMDLRLRERVRALIRGASPAVLKLMGVTVVTVSIAGVITAANADVLGELIGVIVLLAMGFFVSRVILSLLRLNWVDWSDGFPEGADAAANQG